MMKNIIYTKKMTGSKRPGVISLCPCPPPTFRRGLAGGPVVNPVRKTIDKDERIVIVFIPC